MNRPFQILVVDDDEDDIFFVRQAVREMNIACRVLPFRNAGELFSFLNEEQNTADAIVLDLNMPQVDGYMIMKKLKAIPACSEIPVFVLTTSRSSADILKSKEFGCREFYSKPVNLSGYVKTVEDILTQLSG